MHVGFIMDGNGRWALSKGLTRAKGHDAGIETANTIMKACVQRKIPYATFYAFSVQNWSRDRSEIENIYDSGSALFKKMRPWVHENNVKVQCIGNKFRLMEKDMENENPKVREAVRLAKALIAETQSNTGTVVTLCVSYGGREEILDLFQGIEERKIPIASLTTAMVSDFLPIPDVDLVIRTSGEYRISNFLLWQSAYAEYAFTKTLWPDFTTEELDTIFADFHGRDRRFGTLKGPSSSPHSSSWGYGGNLFPPPEDLKELYLELFTELITKNTSYNPYDLYRNLKDTYSFYKVKEIPESNNSSPVSVGATEILKALHTSTVANRYTQLATAFTLETLDHVCNQSMRLFYIDTTAYEKQCLQRLCECEMKQKTTTINAITAINDFFAYRCAAMYYLLCIYGRHAIHEDCRIFSAIVLTFCADVLDKRFNHSYFDMENLEIILMNAVQEVREKDTSSPTKDFMTWATCSVINHYFTESQEDIPLNSKIFFAFILDHMKETAATQFLDTSRVGGTSSHRIVAEQQSDHTPAA